jgi:hypothetical protein
MVDLNRGGMTCSSIAGMVVYVGNLVYIQYAIKFSAMALTGEPTCTVRPRYREHGLHVLVILRLVTAFLQSMQTHQRNWFNLRLLDATVNTGGERTYIETQLMIGKTYWVSMITGSGFLSE